MNEKTRIKMCRLVCIKNNQQLLYGKTASPKKSSEGAQIIHLRVFFVKSPMNFAIHGTFYFLTFRAVVCETDGIGGRKSFLGQVFGISARGSLGIPVILPCHPATKHLDRCQNILHLCSQCMLVLYKNTLQRTQNVPEDFDCTDPPPS